DYFGSAMDPTNSSVTWMAGEYMQAPTVPPAVPFPLWSTVLSAITSTPGNGTFSAPTGNITAPTGNITAPTGNITAPTGNITAPTGNITAPTGNITAPTGNITAPTGNITQAPGGNITNLTSGQICADGTLPDVNGL